ncbi:MAG: homoserine O-acetyltransferase [Candidatus Eisenbacteria bacterium]
MNEHRELWRKSPTTKLARVVHLDLPEGFHAVRGGHLPSIQVSYESWGEPDGSGDNTILLAHALTSDCHATGAFARQPLGWWEGLIGPGRALDTERYHVICPNLIGGCYGTTGPRFPAPDGQPWLGRFPLLTPLDMMRVQRLFVRALGIGKLRMVVGPSMGGMVAWEWAIEAEEGELDLAVVIGAPLRTTAYQIGLNWLQRRGIELDLKDDQVMAEWGQMVARGVGMLSYRNPVGLEEKFGREWFQEPGTTLAERGRYNVESWLRHHGLRSAKRFDPYTYILFSRAMDLHDVGEKRGGLIAALDRVRCRVLIVGVSSDQLYMPGEVHQGADILNHLGKPVEYAELRSPHGHDAVFIETDQIAEFLGGASRRESRILPTPRQREARPVRIGILGAGRVASLFARLLDDRRARIREDYDLDPRITAVADTDPEKTPGSEFHGASFTHDPNTLVERDDVDVILELTNGTASHTAIERALRRRRPVVTPNKALVRAHGEALESLALENGVRLAYHNAVAAGWPLLYAIERPLVSMVIQSVEAMLSCAANRILERLEEGSDWEGALREKGFTDWEPELHTSGWDSAQKLVVLLARAKGVRYSLASMTVRGIAGLDPLLLAGACGLGLRVKLVAIFEQNGGGPVAGVLPAAVPAEGYIGSVRGEDNVVVLRSGEMGEMVYLGKGRGSLPVATAVLNDLIGLYHPSRSWTGRYPRAAAPPREPVFDKWLVRDGSEVRLVDEEGPGAVAVLESLRKE